MTTALEKAQPSSLVSPPNGFQPVPPPDKKPRRLGRWFASDAAWPVTTMLVLWPVWWLLGIGEYAPVLFAIPMARRLYLWHASGRRSLRLPPGFGIWLLFLLVTLFSLATISETAPGTMASPVSNRLISYSLRTISYLGATILLLYVGNLTERELPRRRLAALLGMVGLYTVAGGLAGMALPQVKITSPLSYLVPASLQASNGELQEMLHPSLSQVQNFLGYAAGRPTAPFTYTNMWGNSLAILVPWILVAWWSYGKSRKQRRLAAAAAAIAVVPAIYSLNRGLWIGIGFAVVYVAVRLAARGKMAVLGALCGALALAAIVILASPLQSVISQRLDHGASNAGRTAGSLIALQDGLASPVIGWGDTRHQQGSGSSIAVGRTANCRNCGQTPIGGNGQVQLLLITSGLLGTALYCGFFVYGVWRYRRDPTPYGMASILVLLVGFIFMFVYDAVGPTLAFTMLAYVLLWRNDQERRQTPPAAEPAAGRGPQLTAGDRRAIAAGPGA